MSTKESIAYYMEYLSSNVDQVSWFASTSLIAYYHVIQFIANLDEHDPMVVAIRRLSDMASQQKYLNADFHGGKKMKSHQLEAIKVHIEQEVEKVFINSFVPQMHRFFKVPKLSELSEKDRCLELNEIMAGCLVFLLQILESESAFWSSQPNIKYALLQKNLTFVLTILGDTPFWCSGLEDVHCLLVQCKSLSNETGHFIYSCVFASKEMRNRNFDVGIEALLETIHKFLNDKLKNHIFTVLDITRVRSTTLHSPLLVDSLIEDINGLRNGQPGLIDNVDRPRIESLVGELTLIGSGLKDIQMLQVTDLKAFMTQIGEVVNEASYLINTFVMGHIPSWYLNLRLPGIVQKVKLNGERVQEIKNNAKVTTDNHSFSVGVSYESVHDPEIVVDNMVMGFEDNRINILADLFSDSRELQLVSICGMAGIGKSTIAKKLYNDKAVHEHFDIVAWCDVSQTYDSKKMLHDIWMSLSSKLGKIKNTQVKKESVDLEIHKSLWKRRYLIIMDDVWQSEMWDNMKKHFPDCKRRSRILLTSRVKDTAPAGSIFYEPPFLSISQCRELLVNKVFNKKPIPSELSGIAEKIATKCHGLPLAVVVVAGILVNWGRKKHVGKRRSKSKLAYV